jgi:AcrR family transcriptional regulator
MATKAHEQQPAEGRADPRMGRRGSAAQTRERILDLALELFTEQGYDATSLRDIAERLGTTKAALYYHFARKEDILLELHLRLHALGREVLDELEAMPDDAARAEVWPRVLDRLITQVADNRELLLLHQRNQNAFRGLVDDERHQAENEDLEQRFRRLLSNPELPAATRMRMACSLFAAMGGIMAGAEMLADVEPDEQVALVRQAVARLLN